MARVALSFQHRMAARCTGQRLDLSEQANERAYYALTGRRPSDRLYGQVFDLLVGAVGLEPTTR